MEGITMTQDYQTGLPSDPAGSTKQTAKDQASGLAGSAAQSGSHLAGEAKAQAGEVGREAGRQAKDLLTQGRTQITQQASQQQTKLASGVHTFGDELDSMVQASPQSGMASDVARQVAQRAHSLGSWLDQREPADILEEVKSFARNRPGTFVLLAAGAGLLVGRLTRGIKDGTSTDYQSSGASHRAPGAPSTTGYGLETDHAGTPNRTSAYGVAGATYGTGTLYGATESTGEYGAGGEYRTASGEPTYGLEREGSHTSAAPTTQGSSDDTLAFNTSSTEPYVGVPDTYGTGTENPPDGGLGYDGDTDSAGTFGGGTTEVPEHDAETPWPPVHGEGDQR